MTSFDDIKGLEPASQSEKPDDPGRETTAPAAESRRSVGPESEVRGGPEAPSDAA